MLSLLRGVLLAGLLGGAVGRAVPSLDTYGRSPTEAAFPDTTKYCSRWVNIHSPPSCAALLRENHITLAQFSRWVSPSHPPPQQNAGLKASWQNPSVKCGGVDAGHSYCVAAASEPPPFGQA